jgi:hypothetical protein
MSQEEGENPEALGLGYLTTTSGAISDILLECWAYHEQQERIRNRAKSQEAPYFVPSETATSVTGSIDIPHAGTNASQSLCTPNDELQKCVDAARERARAVLEGFHKPHYSGAVETETTNFKEQRQKGFQREAERKQQALLRNWAYLMDRQNRRAEQLSTQVESSHAMKTSAEQQYSAVLQKRMDLLQKGGITDLYRSRKTAKSSLGTQPNNTAAVYWSTAPPNITLEESDVRQLFGPYGTICKIVQYRNKETGLIKGDGLVVYQMEKANQPAPRDLILLVCGQVSVFTVR